MDLAGSLKNAIDTSHRQIESTAYARALFSGSINPRDYARSLAQFLQIHESLEDQLAKHPGIACYDPASMERSTSLRRDIAWWGGFADEAPLSATSSLIATIERWGLDQPTALIGALYVFEGSRMGSMVLAGSLSRGFGVPVQPGTGLDYHVDGIATRPLTWRGFRETLNALELTQEEREQILDAAVTTMTRLCELYSELPVSEVHQELGVPA